MKTNSERLKATKLKWYQDAGDLCCKRERDGIYASVSWMVAPCRYQVYRMRKKNGEWVALAASPSFPLSIEGRAKAKKWASDWILSLIPNNKSARKRK